MCFSFSTTSVSLGQTGGRTDGQTDTTKLIVTFRNFVKDPKCKSFSIGLENSKFSKRRQSNVSVKIIIFYQGRQHHSPLRKYAIAKIYPWVL
jgi:hypothetical protein